jgi:ribosomal protein L24E
MPKTICSWCLKVIEKEALGTIEFPKQDGLFFCSKKCLEHAVFKRQGKKDINYDKLCSHTKQVIRRQNSNIKSQWLDSLMRKRKLDNEDLALLHSYLTPRQIKVISVVGLANLSWAVGGSPEQLMIKIENLVKTLGVAVGRSNTKRSSDIPQE